MSPETLDSLKNGIKNTNTCEDLAKYKAELTGLIQQESVMLAEQIAGLAELTNPLTFIEKMIEQNLKRLVDLKKLQQDLSISVLQINNAIAEQAAKIPNCNIS